MFELSAVVNRRAKGATGRGVVDTYFTRVYNPVWTNPDGFNWVRVLTDESLVGLPSR